MYRVRAEALRTAAAKRGDKSGYAIAARTGLAESTVSRLMRGKVAPGLNTLMLLSQAYGVPAETLLEPAAEAAA